LKVFTDVMSLRSGDDWERKLYQAITNADVFTYSGVAMQGSPNGSKRSGGMHFRQKESISSTRFLWNRRRLLPHRLN